MSSKRLHRGLRPFVPGPRRCGGPRLSPGGQAWHGSFCPFGRPEENKVRSLARLRSLEEDTLLDKLVRFVFGAVVGIGVEFIYFFLREAGNDWYTFKAHLIFTAIAGVMGGIYCLVHPPKWFG